MGKSSTSFTKANKSNAKVVHDPRVFETADKKVALGKCPKRFQWKDVLGTMDTLATHKKAIQNIKDAVDKGDLDASQLWITKIMPKEVCDTPLIEADIIKGLNGTAKITAYCDAVFDEMINGKCSPEQHKIAVDAAERHLSVIDMNGIKKEWEQFKKDMSQ